jgi:hypothetical protein
MENKNLFRGLCEIALALGCEAQANMTQAISVTNAQILAHDKPGYLRWKTVADDYHLILQHIIQKRKQCIENSH